MNPLTTLEPTLDLKTPEAAGESAPAAAEKARKPRVWTAFFTLLLAALAGFVASIAAVVIVAFVTGVVAGASGNQANVQAYEQAVFQNPFVGLLMALVPFQAGMALVVLYAGWRSKQPIKQRLGLVAPSGRKVGGLSLLTLAGLTSSAAITSAIVSNLLFGLTTPNSPVSAAINEGTWLTITLVGILLSVIPALVEETLFRGYIQRTFLQRWSPAVAIGASTVLFAVMHFDSLQHMIAVLPLGVVTGLLAYRTKSVKPGMVVHMVHNVAAVGFGTLGMLLIPRIGVANYGLVVIGSITVMGLAGLPAVISLVRGAKPQLAKPEAAIETLLIPEPVVQTLSVLKREMSLPDLLTGSQLSQAV